jgi:hypothetical protein
MGLLATYQFYFILTRVEVSQFQFPMKWGREDGDLRGCMDQL